MGVHGGPETITDGLVLCFDAGNNKSYPGTGTTWSDLSGNNNATLINGPTYSPSNKGNITFDGSNEYAIFNSLKSTSEITIGAWTKILNDTMLDDFWHKILIFPYGQSSWIIPFYSYQLVTYKGFWGVGFNVNTIFEIGHLSSTIAPVVGEWTYLVGTFNAGIMRLYLNGVLNSTKDVTAYGTSILYTARTQAVLGVNAEYFLIEKFAGQIGIIQIYNRMLSDSEIFQNYNSTKGRYRL